MVPNVWIFVISMQQKMEVLQQFDVNLIQQFYRKRDSTPVNFAKPLQLVSAIFYQIFIFLPNDSPSKTIKTVFYFI